MTDWKRVKDKRTKHEYTTAVVDKDHHEVLDKPATNSRGNPLPVKLHVSVPEARKADTATKGEK